MTLFSNHAENQYVSVSRLREFMGQVFTQTGVTEESSTSVVEGLLYASVRGVDSHGIRLFPHYVESVEKGVKNGRPVYEVTPANTTCFTVNADGAFGLAAGVFAVGRAMEVADLHGMGFAIVKNSTHPAALSAVISHAVSQGFIAFGFANADALMASHGGKKAFFGTNPLAFGAPVREGSDVILDMATTHFTWNKVKIYRDEGRALPEGVAVDRGGAPTTDPHTARALLPTGSHKGFALAAMVEIMTSVMARGLISPEVAPMYAADLNSPRGLSQSYLVLKPSNLKGDALFEDALQSLISALVCSEPLQDLGFPGAQEERIAAQRLRDGIPLDTATYSRFRKLGEVFGVEL